MRPDSAPIIVRSERLADLAAYSGDPWNPENPYFAHAERFMEHSGTTLIWPVLSSLDLSSVLDLAAGHGRNSVKLLEVCGQLSIMDILPGNVDVCRTRFGESDRIHYGAVLDTG